MSIIFIIIGIAFYWTTQIREKFVSKIDCDKMNTFNSISPDSKNKTDDDQNDVNVLTRFLRASLEKNATQVDSMMNVSTKSDLQFHAAFVKNRFSTWLLKLTTPIRYVCTHAIVKKFTHDPKFEQYAGEADVIVVNDDFPQLDGKHLIIKFYSRKNKFILTEFDFKGLITSDKLMLKNQSSAFSPLYSSYSGFSS